MTRPLAALVDRVRELFGISSFPLYPLYPFRPLRYTYVCSYTKPPYIHDRAYGRMYTYNVDTASDILVLKPYEIDLMGYPDLRKEIHIALRFMAGTTSEGLDEYKQIVIHYQTYTGVITIQSEKDVVLELHFTDPGPGSGPNAPALNLMC